MYGTLTLTESSPAQSFTEVFTVDEIKKYLGVPVRSPADDYEDAEIESLIAAARDQAEIMQNRDLVRKQWDLTMDAFPSWITLRQPFVSLDLLQYRDSDGNYTEIDTAGYIVDPGKAVLLPPYSSSWPAFTAWPSGAVLARFTSGYAANSVFWRGPGERIKNGMKLLISAWFNNKLPFELGANAVQEYPFTVTACLSYGARERVF